MRPFAACVVLLLLCPGCAGDPPEDEAWITIDVVDGAGAALPAAMVELSSRSESDVELHAEAGTELHTTHAGLFRATASAPGFQRAEDAAIQLLPGHRTAVRLVLERAFMLRGTVVDAHGDPVAGVDLRAYAEDLERFEPRDRGVSGPDGRFAIEGLPAARFTLIARPEHFLQRQIEHIDPTSGEIVVALDPGRSIDVEVVVPGAKPGSSTLLEVGRADAYLHSGERRDVVLDENGRGVSHWDGLDPESFRVVAIHEGVASNERRVDLVPGSASLSFTLPEIARASIAGRVMPGHGERIVHARVILDGGTAQTDASEDGAYRFEGLAGGRYAVEVSGEVEEEDGTARTFRAPSIDEVEVERDQAVLHDVAVPPAPELPGDDGRDPEAATGDYSRYPVPAITVEDGLILTAPAGSGLAGGDRLIDIDGNRGPDFPLRGDEGSPARITVERPLTGEHITVTLPRDGEEIVCNMCGE